MIDKIFNIKHQSKKLKISTRYRYDGNELIMFIHGLGCAKEAFDDVEDLPEFEKFSLLTPDLIGFGNSSKPANFSYSMEEHAIICKKLLSFFPNRKVHLVMHSMGGAIGLILAEKIMDTLKSFINIEGNLIGIDCGVSRKAIVELHEDFRKRLYVRLRSSPERGERLWASWIEKSDVSGFIKSARSLVEWSDSGKLLKKFIQLKCKKAYIYGQKSARIEVLKKIEGVNKICITGSGHFPMNDNPEEFYTQLARLLR